MFVKTNFILAFDFGGHVESNLLSNLVIKIAAKNEFMVGNVLCRKKSITLDIMKKIRRFLTKTLYLREYMWCSRLFSSET